MPNMIIISIDTSNAVFEYDGGREVARILTNLAAKFADRGIEAGQNVSLRDVNGNNVGSCNTVAV